ncbi:hypothetical protein ACFQ8C_28615 [Streptomyces sp. NPDC056503]|uniref:hypothetical protein n=1 Tax=Streptomyces sp. NPDC056503 TaxID=3345842 RepID=UPI0036CD5A61
MLAMSSVRTTMTVRALLLLVLALVWTTCVPPTSPAAPSQLQQSGVQNAVPGAGYEAAHAAGGEADAPRGPAVRHDRRRAVTAAARPLGPPSSVARTHPLPVPATGRTGGPDSRPRRHGGHDAPVLQVFLC